MGELLMNNRRQPSVLKTQSYTGKSGARLGSAIELLLEYQKTNCGTGDFDIIHGDKTIVIRWVSRQGVGEGRAHEIADYFAGAVSFGRWVAGAASKPDMVTFEFSATPQSASQYQALFGCPVLFNQPFSSIILSKKLIQPEMSKGNSQVYQLRVNGSPAPHSQQAAQYYQQDDIKEQVQRYIEKEIVSTTPSLKMAAAALGLKSWTLRRRLREQGSDFSGLLEAVRTELATHFLSSSKISISEISEALSYSEVSAFNRAFKRWLGVTPIQYRNKHSE